MCCEHADQVLAKSDHGSNPEQRDYSKHEQNSNYKESTTILNKDRVLITKKLSIQGKTNKRKYKIKEIDSLTKVNLE